MAIKFFGQFLLQRGKITAVQLGEAVKLQDQVNVKIGTRAIDRGLMTPEQVQRINNLQRQVDKRFGELAIDEGIITKEQLEELLSAQKSDRLFLGEALVKGGFLSVEELNHELEAFRQDQVDVPNDTGQIYAGLANAKELEAITDICGKMFTRLVHQFVKPTACHSNPAVAGQYDFFIYQQFKGKFNGLVGMGFSTAMLLQVGGKMLTEELTEVDELAIDGAMEFINTFNGNVIAKLSQLGRNTDLLPPQVHDGRGGGPVDFAGHTGDGAIALTPLHYPDGHCELCVIDKPSE